MAKPVLFIHPDRSAREQVELLCKKEIIQAFTPEQARSLSTQLMPDWVITHRDTMGWPLDCVDRKLLDYDQDTGLLTRKAFLEKLALRAPNTPTLILIFSIDRFSDINDTFGLEAGDETLRAVGERVEQITRQYDETAHLGSDIFAVMIAECQPQQCQPEQVAKRFFQQLSQPYYVQNHVLHLSFSLGAAYSVCFNQVDELFNAASRARTEAKHLGGGRVVFYESQMSENRQRQLMLENHLRYALERNEIEVWYQPQVDAATQQTVSLEALMRWNHSRLGLLSPQEFIPIAERTGLIEQLSLRALEIILADLKALEKNNQPLKISINLSPQQFHYNELLEHIAVRLKQYGVSPSLLEVEIIESQVMPHIETAIDIIKKLKALGIHIALDDFGTGYSSLAWLSRLPADSLKIDQSFIKRMNIPSEEKVIQTIIALGKAMNLQIIAEGVETAQQATQLQAWGVDKLQGYLFGKPQKSTDFIHAFLQEKP